MFRENLDMFPWIFKNFFESLVSLSSFEEMISSTMAELR